ncbi:MAG: phosphoglucosamine mutase [Planctomycetes bacterium]|nr:phosphoglucosamine mutase [Planctomycetota bacterium]
MFGTDGVRAKVGQGPLALENVLALGRAIGRLALAEPELFGPGQGGADRPRCLVGRDTRGSGPMIEMALVAGLVAQGVDVVQGGVLPTPAVASLVASERYSFGIVVSASHNPYEYNGIKIFEATGKKIDPALENRIEAGVGEPAGPLAPVPGRVESDLEAGSRYFESILADPAISRDLSGFRIVFDCANGAVGEILRPAVVFNLQVEATFVASSPDGANINAGCGATDPAKMARETARFGADMGFAFDGDGDRVILADEDGNVVDGDAVLLLLALDLAARRKLPVPRVVGTVLSNFGLELGLAEAGIELVRVPVGDRNVALEMARTGAVLGGEPSGHVIFGDRGGILTGDGLYTAFRVLSLSARTGSSLSQLAGAFQPVPQVQVDVPVARRVPFEELASVVRERRSAEKKLGRRGRVLLRYSGTEDLARVMVEGEDAEEVRRLAALLAAAIERDLGAASPKSR